MEDREKYPIIIINKQTKPDMSAATPRNQYLTIVTHG
jgi:hypothetical protein